MFGHKGEEAHEEEAEVWAVGYKLVSHSSPTSLFCPVISYLCGGSGPVSVDHLLGIKPVRNG